MKSRLTTKYCNEKGLTKKEVAEIKESFLFKKYYFNFIEEEDETFSMIAFPPKGGLWSNNLNLSYKDAKEDNLFTIDLDCYLGKASNNWNGRSVKLSITNLEEIKKGRISSTLSQENVTDLENRIAHVLDWFVGEEE